MAVEFKQDSILDWLLETQDKSTIKDTAEQGCSGGTISELIYYADTSAFYEKYQDEIWRRLNDMAQDMDCESILHLHCSSRTCWPGGQQRKCAEGSAWTGTQKKDLPLKCRRF